MITGFNSLLTNLVTTAKKPTAADEFSAFMKESPAQRLEDQWLSSHGLTKEKLDAMPPDQRAAVQHQMAQDLKEQAAEGAKRSSRTADGFYL